MKIDNIEILKTLEERLAQLGNEITAPMPGSAYLHKKRMDEDALSCKVKELMALAIGMVVGCESWIAYQVHEAIAAGLTRQEMLETIRVGAASIDGAHALDAVNQFFPIEGKQPRHLAFYFGAID